MHFSGRKCQSKIVCDLEHVFVCEVVQVAADGEMPLLPQEIYNSICGAGAGRGEGSAPELECDVKVGL